MGYKWEDSQLIEAVSTSGTLAQVMVKLGLVPAGGNYQSVKGAIERLNLDTTHFVGQSWSKGIKKKSSSGYTGRIHIKKHLIVERGFKCESCYLSRWLGNPIPLELEHIDGNTQNNEDSNLKLLCCNCHALTSTWRRRKTK